MIEITYIGTYATGILHQMFDTCFLHVCTIISSRVDCYKHKSTFGYIRAKGIQYGYFNKIVFHPIYILAGEGRWKDLFKCIIGVFQNVYLYLKSPLKNIVVINYNNVFALYLLNLACKLKKTKLIVVCHGEMDLLQDNRGGFLAKINRIFLKTFYNRSKIADNLYFIVLGTSILNNLKNRISDNCFNHFFSINHPYYFENRNLMTKETSDKVLKLGLIGTLSKEKGLEDFIQLVELLEKKNVKCVFSIVGRINTHDYDEFMKMHNVNVAWDYLSREEMEKRVSRLDCVLYFYPSNSYKLIASGAVFDAISMKVPIVAIKNDFFEYVFSEINYPAFLCDDILEIASLIESQAFTNYSDLGIDCSSFTPEKVACDFFEIITKIS